MAKKRSIHRNQHRPEAEEKKRNRQLAEAKREVHKLRRQVARLQKEASRVPEPPEESPATLATTDTTPTTNLCEVCPSCAERGLHEPVRYVDLGSRTLKVCEKCGYRRATINNGMAV